MEYTHNATQIPTIAAIENLKGRISYHNRGRTTDLAADEVALAKRSYTGTADWKKGEASWLWRLRSGWWREVIARSTMEGPLAGVGECRVQSLEWQWRRIHQLECLREIRWLGRLAER